jgi:crotonobetainyl-CoA:carnitine CoA-transferase CaiB-like acyl-CoA transferase
MTLALSGIRIVDFTHVFQGPMGMQLLADFGADVIKIERPGAGDWSRTWGPYIEGVSLPFVSLNRNKRSLTVDLRNPQGIEIVHKLVQGADVLVHNFRPGVMEKLGLGYEQAHALNPRLIYARSSGWGDEGPYVERGRGGHDMLARASAGWFEPHGESDLPEPGGLSVDYPAGLLLTVGILTALMARERTGQGQLVSTDLLSAAFHANTWMAAEKLNAERAEVGAGTSGTEAAINKSFRTREGYLEISPVFSSNALRDISVALGLGDLSADPRFDSPAKQVANRKELNAILQARLMDKTAAEWEAELEPKGVLCGVIKTFEEAASDPQIAANKMVVELVHPRAGALRVLGTPVRLSETPATLRVPPPDLGEHTDSILSELGYTSEQIAALRDEKVIP